MPLVVPGDPGVSTYQSDRYEATVTDQSNNTYDAYVYMAGNEVQFTTPTPNVTYSSLLWTTGETHYASWIQVESDETVTVQLTGTPTITKCVIYPLRFGIEATIVAGVATFDVPVGKHVMVITNDQVGDPMMVFVDEQRTPTGTQVTFVDKVSTPTEAGKTLVFEPGVWDIGQKFKVNAGSKVFLKPGAWLTGSFDLWKSDHSQIDGHGVLSGEQWDPETVQGTGDYFDWEDYSLCYGGAGSQFYKIDSTSIEGIILTKAPFYSIMAGACSTADEVKLISPWWGQTDGMLVQDDMTTGRGTITNCFLYVCDDSIHSDARCYNLTATNNVICNTLNAAFRIGYWATDMTWQLNATFTDNYVVALTSLNPINDIGSLFSCWNDETRAHQNWGRRNVHVNGLYIDSPYSDGIRVPVVQMLNKPYGLPGVDSNDGVGDMHDFTFQNVVLTSEPLVKSEFRGVDYINSPRDITFTDCDWNGRPLSVFNFAEFFTVSSYTYGITVDGRRMMTPTEICNLALSYLGDKAEVQSISPTDGSTQSAHCAVFYPLARDTLLEMHEWAFATRKATLSELATSDNDAWDYMYELPSDFLKAISVIPLDSSDDFSVTTVSDRSGVVSTDAVHRQFAIELNADGEQVLYTDEEDAVLRYTAAVTDSSQFSNTFILALSWQLAGMLAGPLVKGAEGAAEAQRCQQMMAAYLATARKVDTQQIRQADVPTSTFIAGR